MSDGSGLPVQFSGESPWDAIINHYSLDIVEEESFLLFCVERQAGEDSDIYTLQRLYDAWVEAGGLE